MKTRALDCNGVTIRTHLEGSAPRLGAASSTPPPGGWSETVAKARAGDLNVNFAPKTLSDNLSDAPETPSTPRSRPQRPDRARNALTAPETPAPGAPPKRPKRPPRPKLAPPPQRLTANRHPTYKRGASDGAATGSPSPPPWVDRSPPRKARVPLLCGHAGGRRTGSSGVHGSPVWSPRPGFSPIARPRGAKPPQTALDGQPTDSIQSPDDCEARQAW